MTVSRWPQNAVVALPEPDVARAQRWCADRVPAHARDQVLVECEVAARHLTIMECRPPWMAGHGDEWTRHPVARLSYVQARCEWTLLWRDRNLHWHVYGELAPGPSVDPLLEEIGSGRNPVFWG